MSTSQGHLRGPPSKPGRAGGGTSPEPCTAAKRRGRGSLLHQLALVHADCASLCPTAKGNSASKKQSEAQKYLSPLGPAAMEVFCTHLAGRKRRKPLKRSHGASLLPVHVQLPGNTLGRDKSLSSSPCFIIPVSSVLKESRFPTTQL